MSKSRHFTHAEIGEEIADRWGRELSYGDNEPAQRALEKHIKDLSIEKQTLALLACLAKQISKANKYTEFWHKYQCDIVEEATKKNIKKAFKIIMAEMIQEHGPCHPAVRTKLREKYILARANDSVTAEFREGWILFPRKHWGTVEAATRRLRYYIPEKISGRIAGPAYEKWIRNKAK